MQMVMDKNLSTSKEENPYYELKDYSYRKRGTEN